jgi:AcrR family transcriptional regulator
MPISTAQRRMSGGPVLQSQVTDAIRTAFFAELAEVGYGRLSIDAVARRAGVGKAAIYRRWRSKLDMTVDLASAVAVAVVDAPDTGSLRADIRQYLEDAHKALTHSLAQYIIPDLLAEATRNPDLANALIPAVRTPRRATAALLFQRAIERGELPADSDLEMCVDFLAGPLYWRLAVVHTPTRDDYLDRLADMILAAATLGALTSCE